MMARWVDEHLMLAEFPRPTAATLAALGTFGSATLHEAGGQRGALPPAIRPVAPGMRLCGPAFTIASPPQDNLWFHRALALARPGDVLVASVSGYHEAGYWGDVMANAAIAGKLGGLVIDGCVRDGDALAALGFPVFARGLCIRGTGKNPAAAGGLAVDLRIGEVSIRSGDVVVGDADGVVVVAAGEAVGIADAAREREDKEARIITELHAGRTTLELLGLD